jgi:SAM-dependent methyltransferase
MRQAKPYSEACDQNRDPILGVLRRYFDRPGRILEIGSGTGQHAVYFGTTLPHLRWQPSDVPMHLPGIRLWLAEAGLPNVADPLELDVCLEDWPVDSVDGVFSANTAHIMHWPQVEAMFAGVGRVLEPGGYFCLYGPFNENGAFTSESNARFHMSLKMRDPGMGIRDKADLDRLATEAGLERVDDVVMPVNNFTLVWRRCQVRD